MQNFEAIEIIRKHPNGGVDLDVVPRGDDPIPPEYDDG